MCSAPRPASAAVVLFNYNPVRVPSIAPICAACVARMNRLRIAKGLDPIVPLPDAYEACEESELG
jgi:hypothetical protein